MLIINNHFRLYRAFSRNQIRTTYAMVFMISADCGYPLRLLPAVNEKKKRQRESRPSESTEFGRCGARIPRKRRHLIGEAYMEAFIRPKRECINSRTNLFRNNRAKFRTARGISRVRGKRVHGPTKYATLTFTREKKYTVFVPGRAINWIRIRDY